MNDQMKQFSLHLDQLLGIHPGKINTAITSPHDDSALQIASLLKEMDFDAELATRAGIRSRWISQTQANPSPTRRRIAFRSAWFAALIIALALLIAFRQPVLAAVSQLFGYVYIQDAGFLPAVSTRVLQQPVRQEHAGQSLTITRGVAVPSETTLWLEYSDTARPVDGATLTTQSGFQLKVLSWEYSPNNPDTHNVVMHFPPLPTGAALTTLSLPEGWQIPLEWIPAFQSHLPDVRAVPYPATASPEATAYLVVTPQQELPLNNPGGICQEKHGMRLCVLAATTSALQAGTGTESKPTSVLVQTQSLLPALSEKVWMGAIWQSGVRLTDAKGNVYPLSDYRNGALLFPAIPANQNVTLTVPAVLASLDISGQSITVDLGSDPQPDTVIPLDITIPIMGMSVHFSKATFVGDGVSGLRLILNADPVQTVDGVTPISVEIGKPDRVDDLYGGGMLDGGQDIFIELMRPAGKITGIINIPLDKAIVTVQGPFEISFNLPEAASISPTPVIADPNTFSPAPSATPIVLDSYRYNGATLQPGDLLYTVLAGDNTNVYVFPARASGKQETPGAEQSLLLVTLPGAVSQIYIHPDRQGLDYLAGTHEFRDGFSYIDHGSLYTILFADVAPRRLLSFEANPANLVGTTVNGIWSPDGRYAIFRYTHSIPGDDNWKFLWMDMTCKDVVDSPGLCRPHEIPIKPDLALSEASFSADGKRILFSGSDNSLNGNSALFILNFNPPGNNDNITNIPFNHSDLKLGYDLGSNWNPDGSIFTQCSDGMSKTLFCSIDPETGNVLTSAIYSEHLLNYQLTPSGKQVLSVVINHNAPNTRDQEIRLFDLNGKAGPKLVGGREFSNVSISSSERYLAYVPDNANQLNLIDLESGVTTIVQQSNDPWAISWVGWVS